MTTVEQLSSSEVATEYREAILELLMGYAGHIDLPPNEAVWILRFDPLFFGKKGTKSDSESTFQGQLSKLAKQLELLLERGLP